MGALNAGAGVSNATLAQMSQQKGTTATPTFNPDGSIDVVYKDSQNNTVRADEITFDGDTITGTITIGGTTKTTVINTTTLTVEVS